MAEPAFVRSESALARAMMRPPSMAPTRKANSAVNARAMDSPDTCAVASASSTIAQAEDCGLRSSEKIESNISRKLGAALFRLVRKDPFAGTGLVQVLIFIAKQEVNNSYF